MADKVKVLAVCGPTASGKTALAVQLARQLNGEVVSADSMQIYKGLSVGTAKPDNAEMCGIPHHLMDFLSPDQAFSVADYVAQAGRIIESIAKRGRVPILAGGTGLYLSSLLDGVRFSPAKPVSEERVLLQQELEQNGIGPLYAELCRIDPEYAATLHPNNHVRVLRALELYRQTGKTMTQQRSESVPAERPYNARVICLCPRQREMLYARIDARVDQMMTSGLLEEARDVYEHRALYKTAAQAIGYKEFFPYFEGASELESCVLALKQATRNYAKRQLTWFRRMPDVLWLHPEDADVLEQALEYWNRMD